MLVNLLESDCIADKYFREILVQVTLSDRDSRQVTLSHRDISAGKSFIHIFLFRQLCQREIILQVTMIDRDSSAKKTLSH